MLNEAADKPHMFVLEHLVCILLMFAMRILISARAKGDATPSFSAQVLQDGVTSEEEEIVKWAAFSMYLGTSLKV